MPPPRASRGASRPRKASGSPPCAWLSAVARSGQLSGSPSPDVQAQARLAGFDTYVTKPVDTTVLFALIDDLKTRVRPR